MSEPSDVTTNLIRPLDPHVIVLFGASGDLAKRKLLPGLLHLHRAGLLPASASIGTSLDDLDDESFRKLAEEACAEFASRTVTPQEMAAFVATLHFVPTVGRRRSAARCGQGGRGRARRRRPSPPLPQRPARRGAERGPGALRRRPRRPVAHHHGEAVRHRPAERRGRSTIGSTRRSTRARSSGSITSLERKLRRTSWRSGSPTACSSRSGTATTSITSRSTSPRRWPSTSGSGSTRRPAPTATWS